LFCCGKSAICKENLRYFKRFQEMIKVAVGFLADIVQYLNDLNAKLQGEKHTALDLITTICPFQKKCNIFKHVIQNKLAVVIFRVILGKVKVSRFQIFSIYRKVDYQHCQTVW